jgi:hypothetical protein
VPDLTEQQIIRETWERGHFWNPQLKHAAGINENDLRYLKLSDRPVQEALRSYSEADPYRYAKHVWEKHQRAPWFDGVAGPALQAMMQDRGVCPVPDFAPPAGVSFSFNDPYMQAIVEKMQADALHEQAGTGQWRGCHNVGGEYHAALAQWDLTLLPTFLEPHFVTVLLKVREAFAAMGLLWMFCDQAGRDLLDDEDYTGQHVNTHCTFVRRSDGWLGLAILGGRETCSSLPIWAKFLATFQGGTTSAEIVNQWWTLISHELLHNLGRNHVRGGVMNPSLQRGLRMTFDGDTSEQWMRQQFGGVAVPIPDDDNGDRGGGGDNPPESDLQKQIDRLRLENLVQQAQLDYLFEQQKATR